MTSDNLDRSFFAITFHDGDICGWACDCTLDDVVQTVLGYTSKLRNEIKVISEWNLAEGWCRDCTDDVLTGVVMAMVEGRVA